MGRRDEGPGRKMLPGPGVVPEGGMAVGQGRVPGMGRFGEEAEVGETQLGRHGRTSPSRPGRFGAAEAEMDAREEEEEEKPGRREAEIEGGAPHGYPSRPWRVSGVTSGNERIRFP